MKKHFFRILCVIVSITVINVNKTQAQGLGVNTTGAMADTSAMLDVSSTTKGVLIPRMTISQRNAIVTPATGLMVYQIDSTSGFYYYTGSAWQAIAGTGGSGSTGVSHWDSSGVNIFNNNTGNVGIGTSTPLAKLHVADSSVVFSADGDVLSSPGSTPVSGYGRRMMWYADKAAFRAGIVYGDYWDKDSIGNYSVAMGNGTRASGGSSTALGRGAATGNFATAIGGGFDIPLASGFSSIALGSGVVAEGDNSVAIGSKTASWSTIASGPGAIAIGSSANASGDHSTALGWGATSSGYISVAIGGEPGSLVGTLASGSAATAIGYQSQATGDNSQAFGTAATASGIGATSMGMVTTAIGFNSTAIGNGAHANGDYSVSIGGYGSLAGFSPEANGIKSTAIGTNPVASGDYSTAMGNDVSTNSMEGSFAIGDNTRFGVSPTSNDTINQMMMRFSGGYKFYSNRDATQGIRITPDGVAKYLTPVTSYYETPYIFIINAFLLDLLY